MLKNIFTAGDIDYYGRSKSFESIKLQMSNIQNL